MRYWLGILLLLTAGVLSGGATPTEIVILHTNDIHGHFLAEPADWRSDKALVGGMAALSFHLDSVRSRHASCLYLDAGDVMTGNPICNIEYGGVKGGALLELLHRCGASAMCIGNHEFDLGAQHLRDFIKVSPFPVVCANVRERSDRKLITEASRVFEVGGVRVGVIGLLGSELMRSVSRSASSEFEAMDDATTAQKLIDELDPVTDVIILLTHAGADRDSVLAMQLRGLDVIVGGHSHTRYPQPAVVNHIIIVQAGSYNRNLGVLELQIARDTVASYSGSLIELVKPHVPLTSPAATLADSFEAVIREQYGEIIGELAEPWEPSYYSTSNVGNWICDRLRETYRADVALVNSGGIRTHVAAGPISKLDIVQLLPFVNTVVTFEASGGDVLKIAHEQARAQGLRAHGALEMSGMTVEFGRRGKEVDLRHVMIGDKPIDPSARYRVVSIDYVAESQAKHYLGFEPEVIENTGRLFSDVVMEEIRKSPQPIRADSSARLREVP